MGQKMTWEEMKAAFPDEWLLVSDYATNEYGEIVAGIVERHTKELDDIAVWPRVGKSTAFRYTGESTFSGLRSHAEHDHPL